MSSHVYELCPQNNTEEEKVWLYLLQRMTVKFKAITTICSGHRAGQLPGGGKSIADICIVHLQFTVLSHLLTSSQFCKERGWGLPFSLLTSGRIEWPPLRTHNISGGTRTGPSFLDSRFSALAFSGDDSLHWSPNATGNLNDAGWQQDFRNERSRLLLERKPIL